MIVVLEQEPRGPNPAQDRLCDEIVPAACQPPAALIAASQMKTEGHVWKFRHQGIVHFDGAFEPIIQ